MYNLNFEQPQTPSVANIVYRELMTDDDFSQCINLQKDVFNLPETHLISPLFFNLIARKNPPVGISLGVFNITNGKSELLGFIVGFASFLEKSIHTVMLGVKPEHKNKVFGFKLLIKFKEQAKAQNLKSMFCVFEPLETNLARLYMGMDGACGIKYIEENSGGEKSVPMDKLLVKWDLHKIQRDKAEKLLFEKIMKMYPIATSDYMPNTEKVLMEIPDNYIELKKENIGTAIKWRNQTRSILNYYINNNKYIVSNCFTGRINNSRKSYYLLEKNEITSGNLQ